MFSSAVNQNDDAYIKDFIDLIEKEPDVADKLGFSRLSMLGIVTKLIYPRRRVTDLSASKF